MGAPELFAPSTTSGGAPVGGSGSPNTIPLWSTSTTLTDSALSQSGAIVTNSGTFRAANGAPAEPAYTFSGSSGTGMYRATSGALLRFAVSSAYAFGVDTNGNFGIGTTSPTATSTIFKANNSLGAWNAQDLSVDGLSNGDAVYQRWYATGIAGAVGRFGVTFQSSVASFVWNSLFNSGVQTAELMRLTGGGYLGIGTASPGAQLQIERAGGLSNAEYLRLRNTTSGSGSAVAQDYYVHANTVATGRIQHTWNGTTYDTTLSVWNNSLSSLQEAVRVQGGGNVGIGTASPDVFSRGYGRVLGVSGASSTAIGINAAAGNIAYFDMGVNAVRSLALTTDGATPFVTTIGALPLLLGTNGAERARIDSSGNVNVGGTAAGRDPAGTRSLSLTGGTSLAASLDLYGPTGSSGRNWYIYTGGTPNNGLQFFDGTAGAERARIDSAGRLLVGTSTAPSSGEIRQLVAPGTGANGGQQWAAPTAGGAAITPIATNGGAIFYRYSGSVGGETYVERFNFSSTAIQFKDGANLLASIDNSGNVTLPFGGSTVNVSTTNAGVKLPATPGNADTQTLDCYQEGTWVPTLTGFGGTAPTATIARYTRVGRLVTVHVLLTATGGNQFSSTAATTLLTLPLGITPAADAAGSTSNSVIGADGPCVAYTNGNLYVPTFALRTANTILTVTYIV